MAPQERAILVGTELKNSRPLLPVEESLEELARLAETAGLEVLGRTWQRLDQPDPATFIGSGKVEEIDEMRKELGADVILFDDEHRRATAQLEEYSARTRKSLTAPRSSWTSSPSTQTAEGQLQVELAQRYRLPS